jgi:tetratricopeptide (TPR) repeat protein
MCKRHAATPAPPHPPSERPLEPNQAASRDARLQAAPNPPPSLSQELTRRWLEIKKLAETIEDLNYFQMLGVKKESSSNEIRDAYLALAKKWHPDRLPAELRPLRPQVEAVFAYLNEANNSLGDEERRAAYLQTVKEGGGTPAADRLMQRVIDGALSFPKVEILAKQRKFDEALELLDNIIEATGGEPDYYVMRASILLQKHPGADAPYDLMLSYIDKAIRVDKRHEKAHFTRGMILKRLGRTVEAIRHFKAVADMNPKNVEAAREVRLAEMRKQSVDNIKPPDEGGGLFGGLFKKKS